MAEIKDFKMVTVSVICRSSRAESNLKDLDTSNIGVYTMENSIRDLSEEDFRELLDQVPPEVLEEES